MAAEAWFDASTVWTSDIDPGACKIIAHRIPGIPNLGDITKIDWQTVEPVDVLTGGFPCQDLSHAGKRLGLKPGTRSGLWTHMAYAINHLRPRYVVAENVRGLLSASAHSDLEPCPWCVGGTGNGEPDLRALGTVLGDLADLGYDTRWVGLRASDIGAPHGRFRVFLAAVDTAGQGRQGATGRRVQRSQSGQGHRGPAADAERCGRDGRTREHGQGRWEQPQDSRDAPPDTEGDGRDEGGPEPARIIRRPHAALSRDAAADACGNGRRVREGPRATFGDGLADDAGRRGEANSWGAYEPAIRRWEQLSGRPAPSPTETGPKGGQRLDPRFVEWMMGLPAGWVTDVPDLGRNAQLKALGNGVVPAQAYEALRRAFHA